MTSRFRLALVACSLALAGCGDQFNAGPLRYVESETMGVDLEGQAQAPGGRPQGVGQPLRRVAAGDQGPARARASPMGGSTWPIGRSIDGKPRVPHDPRPGDEAADRAGRGATALYRNHCLHCHGVSGAGDGPTSTFLYPPPSRLSQGPLQVHVHPHRRQADPRRPAQDDPQRPARHLDARLRGPDEPRRDRAGHRLRDLPEHAGRDRAGADRRGRDRRRDGPPTRCPTTRPGRSPRASSTSGRRPSRRSSTRRCRAVPPTRESSRGRELFLGQNQTAEKLECTSCHGPQAEGQRAELRRAGGLQRRRLRRRPERRRTSGSEKYDEKTLGSLEELARRLGQPAPPGQPEPGGVQGGPAADRPLLADRQGDQRRQDAGARHA